jgi:hypothetical protein
MLIQQPGAAEQRDSNREPASREPAVYNDPS